MAGAGLLVLVPFLPAALRLLMTPDDAGDLARAWDHLEPLAAAEGLAPPSLLAISMGSIAALDLAVRESHRQRIGAVVLFGGTVHLAPVACFAVTGRVEPDLAAAALPGPVAGRWPHDPLNTPAVFLNLLPYLPVAGDPAPLAAAWQAMARRTWGHPELRPAAARSGIAAGLAAELAPDQRELFLVGCGLQPGGEGLLRQALARGAFRFSDLRRRLGGLCAPVLIVHGRGDDIVPWVEAERTRDCLPPRHPHRLILTGFFAHGGAARPRLRAMAREAASLFALLRGLVEGEAGAHRTPPRRADLGA